jgi:hypothetical protein
MLPALNRAGKNGFKHADDVEVSVFVDTAPAHGAAVEYKTLVHWRRNAHQAAGAAVSLSQPPTDC